jgi:hypothetical protein
MDAPPQIDRFFFPGDLPWCSHISMVAFEEELSLTT